MEREDSDTVRVCWERGIQMIPDEILSEIFSFAVDGQYRYTRTALHLVSRRWNEVAQATPAINRFVRLRCGMPRSVMCARLEHSKNCHELEITLRHPTEFFHETEPQDMHVAMDVVLSSLHRCCKLEIITKSQYAMDVAIKRLTSPAPWLETLSLLCSDERLFKKVPAEIFGGCAPRLTHISLGGVELQWTGPVFSALKKLSLQHIQSDNLSTFKTIKTMAEWSPNLRILEIANLPFSRRDPESPIVFPKLEILDIRNYHPYILQFLRNISTPSLVKLRLTTVSPDTGEPFESPLAAVVGVAPFELPLLKSLDLESISVRPWLYQHCVGMLHRLPTLERLRLHNPSQELILPLATEHESGWLCPGLTYISVHGADDVTPEVLIQLVEGRAGVGLSSTGKGPAALRRLKLSSCRHLMKRPWFYQWVTERGLEVNKDFL